MINDKPTYAELLNKINEQEEELKRFKSENDNYFHVLFTDNHTIKLLIEFETGRIINANKMACNFYGYSYEEFIELNINQINILSDEQIKVEMLNARTNNQNYFAFKHKLKNGEIRDVEVYSRKIIIQNKEQWYSIIHDVTKQKQNEYDLLKAKENAEESELKLLK